ncbi:MAG TPA: hypothetical protein VG759_21575 [Candidatus Angelobacter sp.]|nr:hypothetical protein [Candidatus Angelobacter sp.]
MPIPRDFIFRSEVYLSCIVLAIHCTQCNLFVEVEDPQDQLRLLWPHRGHLGSVTVDLRLSGPGKDNPSHIRISLWPIEIQMVGVVFPVN